MRESITDPLSESDLMYRQVLGDQTDSMKWQTDSKTWLRWCVLGLLMFSSLGVAASFEPTLVAQDREESKAAESASQDEDKQTDENSVDGDAVDGDRADEPEAEINDVEMYRLLADVIHEIEANYVDEIDRKELIEAAIDGMLSRLDQHSAYISPEELRSFRGSIENEYGGIGVQVSVEQGRLTVISPYYGSPAYRSGIMAGDSILSIEGFTTEGMPLERAVELTTGETGTPVKLTVLHKHSNEVETITLNRAIIKMETVLGDSRNEDDTWDFFLDGDRRIGYVRLTGFGRTSASELRAVIRDLENADMQGLILDLRFNPGGLLSSAIQISDFFVNDGRIVSTEGRATRPRVWDARERGTFSDFPVVVLINRYSASASEIVAACLKDNQRAVVMGERSFGKGSVQNVIPLEGGTSALKLTTAGYLRPNGKNIHRSEQATDEDEWGVSPNEGFEIPFDDEETTAYLLDRRRRDSIAADFAGGESDNDSNPSEGTSDEDPANGSTTEDGESNADEAGADDREDGDDDELDASTEFVDRQLAKAVEYLREKLMIESTSPESRP